MAIRRRWQEIREGFEPAFWVANGTELFERLAFYGTTAVLAIYLHETLHFTVEQAGALYGIFGFVVWFLPVLGGTLADRFGFRRSLLFAYAVMTVGYFLLGSLSASWMEPARSSVPLYWLVLGILMIPALGPSVVKPCVAGTTARASTENVRSIGYSIYYTLVNIGGALGPIVAFEVRERIGIESVFRVCALSVFLMFFATLFFFREPTRSGEKPVSSVGAALKNLLVVIGKYKSFLTVLSVAILLKILSAVKVISMTYWGWAVLVALGLACLSRFMWFLVIYSGFWVVYWQEFISVPLFIRGYVNPKANVDLLLSTDALTVICLQIVVTFLTRKIRVFPAMTLGIVISSLSWLILMAHPSTLTLILSLVVLALGEMTQSARYYEYVSRLAPPGQQGLYMGYAFLPIAIGNFIAGPLGGYLVHHYGEVLHRPTQMWWVVTAAGMFTAILMWLYDKIVKPLAAPAPAD